MAMPARPRISTLDEFFAVPEDSSYRHELLDGEYVVSPNPEFRHQNFVMALYLRLEPVWRARRDLVVLPTTGDVVLGPRTVVEPDLYVFPRPGSPDTPWREMRLPLLAVEVLSPGTARRDRGIKRNLYQGAGVPEYWIVDLDLRLVERWRPNVQHPEVASGIITWQPDERGPSLSIDLQELFAESLEG